MGLRGTAQKYLVPTGKKAPHLSLLHIITFTLHLRSQPTQPIKACFSLFSFTCLAEREIQQASRVPHMGKAQEGRCAPLRLPTSTQCIHCDQAVLLHFAGVGGSFWQPPVLLDHFQKGCSTDIYATRNYAQASDGSLLLKGNCTKIDFPHLQKFSVIVCRVHRALLSSHCRERVLNFTLILRGFTKSIPYFQLGIHSMGPLRGQQNTDSMINSTEKRVSVSWSRSLVSHVRISHGWPNIKDSILFMKWQQQQPQGENI